MDKTIKEQLEKMESRLNEVLDDDLFNDCEFDMDGFQSEVCSIERELNEILEFNREHLQFPELETSMTLTMREASCSQMVRIRKRMILLYK